MPDGYRTAQVCLHGHTTTDALELSPEMAAPYCQDCGQPTICACQNCSAGIRGDYHVEGVFAVSEYSPPSFCHQCGAPFPWTSARISAAKELADEFDDLTSGDRETLKGAIDDLSSDTPRTEIAAHRYRSIISKVGKGAAASMRAIVIEIATEATKRVLFGNEI